MADGDNSEMATVASTSPKRPWSYPKGRTNSNQTTKTLSGDVNEWRHDVGFYMNMMTGI